MSLSLAISIFSKSSIKHCSSILDLVFWFFFPCNVALRCTEKKMWVLSFQNSGCRVLIEVKVAPAPLSQRKWIPSSFCLVLRISDCKHHVPRYVLIQVGFGFVSCFGCLDALAGFLPVLTLWSITFSKKAAVELWSYGVYSNPTYFSFPFLASSNSKVRSRPSTSRSECGSLLLCP